MTPASYSGVDSMSLVGFTRTERSNMKNRIKDSLDIINYQFKKRLKKIVLKPNMCYYWDYSTGQTTDPELVTAIIQVLREKISSNLDISIVESDASAMKCKYAFKFLGYEKIAEQNQVRLVNLSDEKTYTTEVTVTDESFSFAIPKVIRDADLRINIPKMKYMGVTKISCALKNIYGCNPYPKKFRIHSKLDEAIVALNKIMRFDLCILDGLIVSGSQTSKLGLIMTSQDPVAMDTAAANIMGVNPRTVKHILLAEKEGLGTTSFLGNGKDLNYFKARYPRRKNINNVISFGYKIFRKLHLDKRLIL